MKKRIIFTLIISILISSFNIINVKAEQKGDLRCPTNSSEYCSEDIDQDGKVRSVTVKTYNEDVTINKIVSKTEDVGRYNIYFSIKGNIKNKKKADAYIVIIMDTSGSVKNNIGTARTAINSASRILKDNYVALVQFATNAATRRNFSKSEISEKIITGQVSDIGKRSFVDRGLKKALSLFQSKKLDYNTPKYIILFGDGEYYSTGYTKYDDIMPNKKSIEKLGNVHFYGIRFKSQFAEKSCGTNNKYCKDTFEKNAVKLCESELAKQGFRYPKLTDALSKKVYAGTDNWSHKCNQIIMRQIIDQNHLIDNTNPSEWKKAFEDLANQIREELYSYNYIGTVNDAIGSQFSAYYQETSNSTSVESMIRNIEINLMNGNERSEEFEIGINRNAETGWHETNDGFVFSYVDQNGNQKELKSSVNPEVYWIQERLNFDACTDEINYSKTVDEYTPIDIVDNSLNLNKESYYKKSCNENLKLNLNINNLETGTKKFQIKDGLGISSKLTYQTDIVCKYTFNQEKYNEDYNRLNSLINDNSIDSQTKNFLQKVLNEFNDELQKKEKILNGNNTLGLEEYKKSFVEKLPVLSVNYNSSELYNSSSIFENKNINVPSQIECVVNGNEKTCTASFVKDMGLKETCISMQDGNIEDCNDDLIDQELLGGNKYFLEKNNTQAFISVTMSNIGYSADIDVTMDNSFENGVCAVDIVKDKTIFRQIDLEDPFLTKFSSINKRTIGRNFSNSKYNFTRIIDKDTWKNNYQYLYQIGKINIDNIVKNVDKDTLVESYLGTNCYIDDNNKYICPFPRDTNYGNNGFFYNSKIND
ncbi:MAG: VWA domain-containing protein [Bacilli bacterium]|nr:VWA domain-containing protein [Bacilli bacterium]